MSGQVVKYIKIKDLVLWTENPRDPINSAAKDQDIVNRALNDGGKKWGLAKLAREMGEYYDFSELPTVVYLDDKPVVYDGNRRIILGKIKLGLVSLKNSSQIKIPDFPDEIPCNVCSEKIALQNVFRKHAESGSWLPLERDIFLNKFMNQKKSPFLLLEENIQLISSNPHLNQRFVKDEILKQEQLERLGFNIVDDVLHSKHNTDEVISIFSDLSQKIISRDISTRKNRGQVFDVLAPSTQELIQKNESKQSIPFSPSTNSTQNPPLFLNSPITHKKNTQNEISIEPKKRVARRVKPQQHILFGKKLYLKVGGVSNLYRDICDLNEYFNENKANLSNSFGSLIRMSLRLLSETAAKDHGQDLQNYLKSHFAQAKNAFDQNIKTTLSNHNVNEGSIVQLLQTGAHNYTTSANMDVTIAISLILGEILMITHGQSGAN